jgi:nicotinamidase/pyrazinamidase
VQGTTGAEFHRELKLPENVIIVSKGMDPNIDSYSSFQAFEDNGTPFAESLRRRGIEHIYVGGLATDYCVKWTALDGLAAGFSATALIDASLGVNLKPHDSELAIRDIVEAGGLLATIRQVGA